MSVDGGKEVMMDYDYDLGIRSRGFGTCGFGVLRVMVG